MNIELNLVSALVREYITDQQLKPLRSSASYSGGWDGF